ncbi:YraN family protein [Amycolatopsis sp. 195334CR]|uniref:YraN family protein n=1 Tax=Amycolatopsis sp. 195334CR TaxID=2814588 RepID=UPI001A8FCD36|nr:YraN family protein [Amycolatopsis sp. 195334CR]MBN6033379.1 YraN family protein [Amycolatopsis sp. 195334CR]
MGTQARPSYEQRQRLGRRGEELAAAHLDKLGMTVLSRNWRCREGELDLVATDGRTLIVCEVKTRSGAAYGHPADSVDAEKSARIRRLTSRWLEHYRVRWCPLRFDVIAIHWPPTGAPQLTHIPGAF